MWLGGITKNAHVQINNCAISIIPCNVHVHYVPPYNKVGGGDSTEEVRASAASTDALAFGAGVWTSGAAAAGAAAARTAFSAQYHA